jgi:hypothetical protein
MRKTQIFFWLIFVALVLVGCRNESMYSENSTKLQNGATFRQVNKKEIPFIMNFLASKTNDFKVSLKTTNAVGKTETVFGEIDANNIIESINENNEIYYVFSIIPDVVNAHNKAYNLEIKTDGAIIEPPRVVVYYPTEDWVLNGNGNYAIFSGRANSYSLDGNLETSVDYLRGAAGPCDPKPPCSDCPTNPHGPGNGPGGGPGQGPGTPTGPTGPGMPTGCQGCGPGGENGSGNPCGWVPIMNDDTVVGAFNTCTGQVNYFYPRPANRLVNPCGGGGVVIAPPQETRCENIKKSTNDSKYKSNIATLEGKTGDDFESGFRLGTSVPNSGQTGTQNQLLQNRSGTKDIELKYFKTTFAIMHSHYDGLFPIFSPADILLFNQWVVWANNYNNSSAIPKIPLNNLTLSVVTSNGNYLLSFDGTSIAPLPAYNQQEFDNLNKDYIRRLDKTHTNGNFDMSKVEKEFLKFVSEEMNMTGLKLFKVKNDGNYEISLTNLPGTKCP